MESQTLPTTLDASPFTLRLLNATDRPAVIAGLNDPAIAAFTTVPSPYTEADFDEWLPLTQNAHEDRSMVNFLITEADGTVIGSIGAFRLEWEKATAGVGYLVYREHRGKRAASTALHAVCRWLLDIGFQRIHADVLPGNDGSMATLRGVGFVHEGTLRSVHAGTCGVDLDRTDMAMFSLLPGDLSELGR